MMQNYTAAAIQRPTPAAPVRSHTPKRNVQRLLVPFGFAGVILIGKGTAVYRKANRGLPLYLARVHVPDADLYSQAARHAFKCYTPSTRERV
eukprot:450216-Pelagomonas_calceolata.AAC.1